MNQDTDDKVTFSPEQQAKLDEILQTRLGEQAATHARQMEATKAEYKKHLPGSGVAAVDMQDYLDQQERKRLAEDRERVELGRLFGPTSDGMQAQKLKRSDPALYKQMRDRAIQLGLVATENRPPAGGTVKNAFQKGALIHKFGEKL